MNINNESLSKEELPYLIERLAGSEDDELNIKPDFWQEL